LIGRDPCIILPAALIFCRTLSVKPSFLGDWKFVSESNDSDREFEPRILIIGKVKEFYRNEEEKEKNTDVKKLNFK